MSFFNDIGCNNTWLSHLQTALTHLPHSIPLGNSNFEHYAPDPERVELYGSTEAALNNALEVTCAPGLIAVVDVLMAALNEFPNSTLLQKWVRDLYRTAVYHYKCAKQPVPSPTNTENTTAAATAAPLTELGYNNAKGDSEALNIDAGDYEDFPDPVAQGPGGHPIDTKLLSLAIRCYKKDDPSKAHMFHCAGTNTGCTTAWKSKNWVKRRILVHAATCEHLPCKLKEKLDGGLAMDAPSAKSAVLNCATANSKAPHSSSGIAVTTKSQPSVAPLTKKAQIEALTAQLHADVVQLFCG
ncbi:hypothetical protein EV702DRAFT_1204953 [Suillus placidus]|uniref:Uncharacterized protein n=1 Tax=Suillus placidus TaxID=48579 RepID=A0A9P6ZG48_9AGAM|nr:hypothetical protein EV702DRAFT_1204953 [Suillus placidus]